MSEKNSNSLNKDDQGNGNEFNSKYEKISSYVDREFDSSIVESEIENQIKSDPDLSNRYNIELAVKNELQKRIKPVQVSTDLEAKINSGIENYSNRIKSKSSTASTVSKIQERTENLSQKINKENYRSSLQQKKYFYIFSGSFVILLLMFLSINFFNQSGHSSHEEDLVSISHNIFNQIERGEIAIQYETSDPRELEKLLSRGCRFKVYIPDVKDATLVGGVYNEINGVPVAHFIHKKDSAMIYTFQILMKDVTDSPEEKNKLYLLAEIKERVNKGENWFPCEQSNHGDNAAIWYHKDVEKDEVLCSSVSKMNFEQIHSTLTDFR